MIAIMLEHDFMVKKRICGTFVLTKRGFSGSGQMLLNTLLSSTTRRKSGKGHTPRRSVQ